MPREESGLAAPPPLPVPPPLPPEPHVQPRTPQLHWGMARLPVRLFGLLLLTLAIVIPSCQAVFPIDANTSEPFQPEFVQD